MGFIRWTLLMVVGASLLEACAGDSTQDPLGSGSIVVDTLESGRVVVKTRDSAGWRAGEGCELQEGFRLGAAEGDGHAFRLNRVDATGDTTMTIEVLRAPIPVTRRERAGSVFSTPTGPEVGYHRT